MISKDFVDEQGVDRPVDSVREQERTARNLECEQSQGPQRHSEDGPGTEGGDGRADVGRRISDDEDYVADRPDDQETDNERQPVDGHGEGGKQVEDSPRGEEREENTLGEEEAESMADQTFREPQERGSQRKEHEEQDYEVDVSRPRRNARHSTSPWILDPRRNRASTTANSYVPGTGRANRLPRYNEAASHEVWAASERKVRTSLHSVRSGVARVPGFGSARFRRP